MLTTCYRNAHGIIIVYDVTNEKSFANLNQWMAEVAEFAKPDLPKMLVKNAIGEAKKNCCLKLAGENYLIETNYYIFFICWHTCGFIHTFQLSFIVYRHYNSVRAVNFSTFLDGPLLSCCLVSSPD